MNKQAGFTLIELVIVIIILGILAVTALPKFINLQGDARYSALQGLKGAIDSGGSIVFSKAAINGVEKEESTVVEDINITYGYPETTQADLVKVANLNVQDWQFGPDGEVGPGSHLIIRIWPTGVSTATSTCSISYFEATSSARAIAQVNATDADDC